MTTRKTESQRIAVVTTSYPSDHDEAAGHFVRADVTQLIQAGHAVIVIAPHEHRTSAQFPEAIQCIHHLGAFGSPGALTRMQLRPDRWLGASYFMWRARQRLQQLGPFNEIHAQFLLPSYWPIAAGAQGMHRVFIHGSDLRLLEQIPSGLRRPILAALQRDQPLIHCVSHELADRFNQVTSGAHASRVTVRMSPITIPTLPGRAELRERLGIAPETKLIIVVARLITQKRVDVALAAAERLPFADVVVCGDGPLRQDLQRRFTRARFLGQLPRQETLMWIAAADVLLSASRKEGAPTVIREARALGVPVVTTAAGDVLQWAATDAGLRVVP